VHRGKLLHFQDRLEDPQYVEHYYRIGSAGNRYEDVVAGSDQVLALNET
jgi:hypothetical protein